MKDGKVEDRLVGLQDVDKLRKFVDKVCSSGTKSAQATSKA